MRACPATWTAAGSGGARELGSAAEVIEDAATRVGAAAAAPTATEGGAAAQAARGTAEERLAWLGLGLGLGLRLGLGLVLGLEG